jgi:hypothetical protein
MKGESEGKEDGRIKPYMPWPFQKGEGGSIIMFQLWFSKELWFSKGEGVPLIFLVFKGGSFLKMRYFYPILTKFSYEKGVSNPRNPPPLLDPPMNDVYNYSRSKYHGNLYSLMGLSL